MGLFVFRRCSKSIVFGRMQRKRSGNVLCWKRNGTTTAGVYFSNSPYQALTQQSSVVALSSPNYNDEDLTDSLSNPSFDDYSPGSGTSSDSNYTGNTQIKVPTSWTADGNKDSSIKMGVINIEQDAFEDNYSNYGLKITNSPALSSMQENENGEIDVLMINSESERIYGYTSSSIDLHANSFYKVQELQ